MHRQLLYVQSAVGPQGRRLSAHERDIVDSGGDVGSREYHLGGGVEFYGEGELDQVVVETILHGTGGPWIHLDSPPKRGG